METALKNIEIQSVSVTLATQVPVVKIRWLLWTVLVIITTVKTVIFFPYPEQLLLVDHNHILTSVESIPMKILLRTKERKNCFQIKICLGVCSNSSGVPSCKCNPGWQGIHCDTFDVCYQNPCLNGGKCLPYKDSKLSFLALAGTRTVSAYVAMQFNKLFPKLEILKVFCTF